VTLAAIKRAVVRTYGDVLKNSTSQAAAALSYYSILSVFPALILLSAALSYVPLPDFFNDVLAGIGRVAPPGAVTAVYAVLQDIGKNSGTWLSFGTLGTLWVVSSAFDEMIEALGAAYDAEDRRPFWRIRLLALGLAAVSGLLLTLGIAAIIVGPMAGHWIAARLALSGAFVSIWPYLHWSAAVIFALLGVSAIYRYAPSVKQRFVSTLPGAFFSVTCWLGLSRLLRIYFKYFGNYNRTYGTLAGVMALITWLYWVYFILIAGGELNAELARERDAESDTSGAATFKRRSTDRAA
jgi:membrane protein